MRMASSTTIPSTTMNANSEIMLIDTSSVGIIQNVPRNEIGMPRLTQNASRKTQEQRQHNEHKTEPGKAVADHQVSPSLQVNRVVLPRGQPDPRRIKMSRVGDVLMNRLRNRDGIFLADSNTFTKAHGLPSKYDS